MEVAGIQGDFVQRFTTFTSAYGRARNKEEKNFLIDEFLRHCTDDEVILVREVIGTVLQKNGLNLSNKLFN
ncbi:MAG: hypothetical protein QXU32_12050 [Nitrososphaerales archaeon]